MSCLSIRQPNTLRRVTVALLIALAAAACETLPATDAAPVAPASAEYRLGAGDRVKVTVFGDQNLSGEHQVDGRGTFDFPLIGAIEAGGMTSDELESVLETKLHEYVREPDVSIEILDYRPFYIVGEVRRPGSYPYVDGMFVINAVAIAGGFTYRAREEAFYVERQDARFAAKQMTPVMPGDVIIVRERFF